MDKVLIETTQEFAGLAIGVQVPVDSWVADDLISKDLAKKIDVEAESRDDKTDKGAKTRKTK